MNQQAGKKHHGGRRIIPVVACGQDAPARPDAAEDSAQHDDKAHDSALVDAGAVSGTKIP